MAGVAPEGARERLTKWAYAHHCPELRFRPWARIEGTPEAWSRFLIAASDAQIELALNVAEQTTDHRSV